MNQSEKWDIERLIFSHFRFPISHLFLPCPQNIFTPTLDSGKLLLARSPVFMAGHSQPTTLIAASWPQSLALPLEYLYLRASKTPNMEAELAEEFIAQSIYRMEEKLTHFEKAMAQVSEEDIWKRPNGSSNTIGNIIIHLCGNITQYIHSSLGEVPDIRKRDAEFAADGGKTKAELMTMLRKTVEKANQVMRDLDRSSLLEVRSVQAYRFSAIGIIIHVVEHFSYHTGQVAFWVKQLKDIDLQFFAGVDLNRKNVI